MTHYNLSSIPRYFISICSTLSLVASTPSPQLPMTENMEHLEEDVLSFIAPQEDVFFDEDVDILSENAADDALAPPSSEDDSNIEDQTPTPSNADVQKVLYNPNMNYGTGAPVPKPAPLTTVKRNLIVLATSAIVATVAMLVVSTNSGRDAR